MDSSVLVNNRKLQTLLQDNQQLAADHVAIKQQLTLTKEDLHRLSSTLANLKAERDAQIREVYERSLRTHAEARSIQAMRQELVKVKKEAVELRCGTEKLTVELKDVQRELVRVKREKEEVDEVKEEIEAIREDINKGRAAIDYEQKIRIINLEQKQAMEADMISMSREIENLRVELANAEKRASEAAAAGPGNSVRRENPGMGYGGTSYPDPYSMNQVQISVDPSPHYGSRAILNGPSQPTQVLYGYGGISNGPSQQAHVQYAYGAMPNGPSIQTHGHR